MKRFSFLSAMVVLIFALVFTSCDDSLNDIDDSSGTGVSGSPVGVWIWNDGYNGVYTLTLNANNTSTEFWNGPGEYESTEYGTYTYDNNNIHVTFTSGVGTLGILDGETYPWTKTLIRISATRISWRGEVYDKQ